MPARTAANSPSPNCTAPSYPCDTAASTSESCHDLPARAGQSALRVRSRLIATRLARHSRTIGGLLQQLRRLRLGAASLDSQPVALQRYIARPS